MIRIICEYCGVVVHAGRDSCQNCGARVFSIPTFPDQRSTQAQVYSTLFKDERAMRIKRFIGFVLLIVGIFINFFSIFFLDFLLGMVMIGLGLGLIFGGIILIYRNFKEFE